MVYIVYTKYAKRRNVKTILVADDDLAILEVIKIILEDSGYSVTTLSDGAGIVSWVKSHNPDVILMDIWMSGHDGCQIARQLKADTQTKQIPVILISAHNNTQRMARDAGADSFIAKPFDISNLLTIVERHSS